MQKIKAQFKERFKSIPPYPGFEPFKLSYEEISSWQGKEIRNMMRFLLAVLGLILIDGVQSSKLEEAQILAAVRFMIEFHLVVGQHNHSDYTNRQLNNRVEIFYRKMFVFRPERTTKGRTKNFEKSGLRWRGRVAKRDGQACWAYQTPTKKPLTRLRTTSNSYYSCSLQYKRKGLGVKGSRF